MISSRLGWLASKKPITLRFISDFSGSSSSRFYPRSFSVVRNDTFFSLSPVNVRKNLIFRRSMKQGKEGFCSSRSRVIS